MEGNFNGLSCQPKLTSVVLSFFICTVELRLESVTKMYHFLCLFYTLGLVFAKLLKEYYAH